MRALPTQDIKDRFSSLNPTFNEKTRRLWAATEAKVVGYGGISAVARATGLSSATIRSGIKEINARIEGQPKTTRIRQPGAGRQKLTDKQPKLLEEIEKIVAPHTRGNPMKVLQWTSKSTTNIAKELNSKGYKTSADTIGIILKQQGYSLQSNRKRFEGKQHPDRNAQFEYIAKAAEEFQARGCPVISVDTKKKELIGNYKNAGKEWTPKGAPIEVEAYDFIDEDKGKAIPYGIYDTNHNLGWVSVGSDHDTAEFAVNSISRWWSEMGEKLYPNSKEILIMADGGGSNGSRSRLWKASLQKWASREGLTVMVCHFPPGTSKWNKIEHRMFCHITHNWRGRPLTSHEVIIQLIGSTTTKKGLRIKAELDREKYPLGKKVSDKEMAALRVEKADFHGEWNYCIKPET